MQVNAVKAGQNVIVVDDLIATGGSAAAAGNYIWYRRMHKFCLLS